MNKKMTRFAVPGKCGCLGDIELVDAAWIIEVSPTEPKPHEV
jgi:hypothetical protein